MLVNQYRGRVPIYHLDAYRTDSLTELMDLGLEEMLHGDGVTLIEWADKLAAAAARADDHVHIAGSATSRATITIARARIRSGH